MYATEALCISVVNETYLFFLALFSSLYISPYDSALLSDNQLCNSCAWLFLTLDTRSFWHFHVFYSTHMQTYTSTNWLLRLALQFLLATSHLPAVFCYNCSRTRVAYCFSHFFRINSCLFATIFLCLSIIFLFFLSLVRVLLCHGSWLLLLFIEKMNELQASDTYGSEKLYQIWTRKAYKRSTTLPVQTDEHTHTPQWTTKVPGIHRDVNSFTPIPTHANTYSQTHNSHFKQTKMQRELPLFLTFEMINVCIFTCNSKTWPHDEVLLKRYLIT